MAAGNEPENAKPVKPLNGPAGLDISPQVPKVARVSWRVFGIVAGVLVLMIIGLYYGLKHRGEEVQAAKVDVRPTAPEVFCTVDPVTGQPDRFERRTGAAWTQWVPVVPVGGQSR